MLHVGGTTLNRDSSTRVWNETAWSGSGSGCSAYEPSLSWQKTNTGCAGNRIVADVAATADPNTGAAENDMTSYSPERSELLAVEGSTFINTAVRGRPHTQRARRAGVREFRLFFVSFLRVFREPQNRQLALSRGKLLQGYLKNPRPRYGLTKGTGWLFGGFSEGCC